MASKPRLYLGNLPYGATDADIRFFFADYEIVDVHIVMDHASGQPRGFAFVELKNADDLADAIADLDGRDMLGRGIRVREASERTGGKKSRERRSDAR